MSESTFLRKGIVSLRLPHYDDVPYLKSWINNPRTAQYLTIYLPMTDEDEKKWVEKARSKQSDHLAFVIDVHDMYLQRTPVGVISLEKVDRRNRTTSLGLFIGDESYRQKGVATTALNLILEYAFMTLNVHNVWLSVISGNKPAYDTYTKCGFIHDATLRDKHYRDGRYVGEIIMSILRTEWDELQK